MFASGCCRCVVTLRDLRGCWANPLDWSSVRSFGTASNHAWHCAAQQAGMAAVMGCSNAVTPGWKIAAEVSGLLPALHIFPGVSHDLSFRMNSAFEIYAK